MSVAELQRLAPQFEWANTLRLLRMGDVDTLIVAETTAIQAAGRMLEDVPLDTWKAWLTFHFIDAFAPYMSTSFDNAASARAAGSCRSAPGCGR